MVSNIEITLNQKILNIKKEEEKRLIEKKKALINKTYNTSKYKKANIESLSFTQRVYLGALLRLAVSEDKKYIKPLETLNGELAPTLKYSKEIIETLYLSRIMLVSTESPMEAFFESSEEDKFPNLYYINKVIHALNVDFDDGTVEHIEKIMNPGKINDEDKEEALKIWKEIALEECLEYLYYQMDKVNFDFSAGEKTVRILKELLEHFSVAQIYGIIYKSIAKATRYYQETNVTNKQAANSVIGHCQKYGERALIENWNLVKYHRAYDLPQSMISEFFFNLVINIGNLGFEIAPISL